MGVDNIFCKNFQKNSKPPAEIFQKRKNMNKIMGVLEFNFSLFTAAKLLPWAMLLKCLGGSIGATRCSTVLVIR
jgi:hypothetical protein